MKGLTKKKKTNKQNNNNIRIKNFQGITFFLSSWQVLAEKEWTLSSFRKCTEDVFHRLYPREPRLKISGIQNEFHFDIPLSYKVDEVLVDTGLVFAMEKEVSLSKSLR